MARIWIEDRELMRLPDDAARAVSVPPASSYCFPTKSIFTSLVNWR